MSTLENILDDRLLTSTKLVTSLLDDGGANMDWLNNFPEDWKKHFPGTSSDTLPAFLRSILGTTTNVAAGCGQTATNGETWHSIPKENGSPTGLYIVLTQVDSGLIIGLGGVSEPQIIGKNSDHEMALKFSGKIPVAKVDQNGTWSLEFGKSTQPYNFSLCLQDLGSGNILEGNALGVQLAGVKVSVVLDAGLVNVDLVLSQLQLPGELTPRDRTLAELADSFNLSFMLNMLLDNLANADLGLALRDLLGLGSGDFPTINWDGLARGENIFSDWFLQLQLEDKIADWLARFKNLLGVDSGINVLGDGTRPDPYRIPLGSSELQLTLALEGDLANLMVYPGVMADFEPFVAGDFELKCTARAEVAGINVHTGGINPLPTLGLDLKFGRDSGPLLANPTDLTFDNPDDAGQDFSVTMGVGSAGGGMVYTHGQGIKGYLEFYDVDLDTSSGDARHWDVMDINSMGAALGDVVDDALAALLDELKRFLGIHAEGSPYASRIGALLGLNVPVSASMTTAQWPVDLTVEGGHLSHFLDDPLQAISWYHSRVIVDSSLQSPSASARHYLMQDLWHLLFGEAETLTGEGTADAPWGKALVEGGRRDTVKSINFEIIAGTNPASPSLHLDFHAVARKNLSEAPTELALDADLRVSLVDLTLPDSATGQSASGALWFADARLGLSLEDLPALSMGSLTVDARALVCAGLWSQADGFDYDISLHDLEIISHTSEDDFTFPWPKLQLPKIGFSGDDSNWSSLDFNLDEFGPIILKLYGQWLAGSSPKGFGFAGLLGLLPDLGDFELPRGDDSDDGFNYDDWTWGNSPWALPATWPALKFKDWPDLLNDPLPTIKQHLALLFSKPEWAIPTLRWLGGLLSDSLPDFSLPEFEWKTGEDKNGNRRMPKLSDLPFAITGRGTYPDPWRLKLDSDSPSEWKNGAILVWLDPEGPPTLSVETMVNAVAPHLSTQGLTLISDVLDDLDLDEMLDLVGLIGGANAKVANLCKGFDASLKNRLKELEEWIRKSDGYGALAEPVASVNNICNSFDLDRLKIANHGNQLSALKTEIAEFVTRVQAAADSNCKYLFVGSEHTDSDQWQDVFSKLGIAGVDIQQHNYCQFGVAPNQQSLNLDGTIQVTQVTLTSLNTEAGTLKRLPMDEISVNSPAEQLKRVVDALQSAGDELIIVSHGTAGFAVQVALNGMDAASRTAQIAGVCTVGMPAIPKANDDLPGVVGAGVLEGVDFLQGLVVASKVELDSVITRGLAELDQYNSPSNCWGYDDRIQPELIEPLQTYLYGQLEGLATSFPGVLCQGFATRIGKLATETVEEFSIKEFLMDWLTEELIIPLDPTTPTHVGFGVSWQDDHTENDILIKTEVRQDLFRVALREGVSDEGLQPLPRTRFGIEVHRPSGWLVGGRNHLVRCRWMEFGLDAFPETCEPSLVFHDAGVNQPELQRIGLDWVEGLLWTAKDNVRILLDRLCDEISDFRPDDIKITPALACFFEATGLFYRQNDTKLLPHGDSWQALLTDPKGYLRTAFIAGVTDSDKKDQLICAFGGLFGLKRLPIVRQYFDIIDKCTTDPEARIALLIMQAMGLVSLEGSGCLPVLANWGAFLQNPKAYISSAWDLFTENIPEAQAKRALFVAEVSIEYAKIDSSTHTPKWLHDLSFDGNRITFTLGGDGFVLMQHWLGDGDGITDLALRIPVELDLIQQHIRVRYEVDVSGVVGCAPAIAIQGAAYGQLSLFFEMMVVTGSSPRSSVDYGIALAGGVQFRINAPKEWQQGLQRLLTQGLGSQFLRRIRDLVKNDDLNNVIGCLVGSGSRHGLLLPGGTSDWHNYLTAPDVRCLLNHIGDLLEVRDATKPDCWLLHQFQFTYPDRGLDLQLGFSTVNPLSLYQDGTDLVTLGMNVGVLLPETGATTYSAGLDLSTRFSDVNVGLQGGFQSGLGASCKLRVGGLGGLRGVEIDLYPFGGFDPLLADIGQQLLLQYLPKVFETLKNECNANTTCRGLCELAEKFCVDLDVLQSDPMGWFCDRLSDGESDIQGAIETLWPRGGNLVIIQNCGIVYTLKDGSGQNLLVVSLGNGVRSPQATVASEWGVSFKFTPVVQGVVLFDFDAGYWQDQSGNNLFWSNATATLAENVLNLAGISIQPSIQFTYDTSNNNGIGLQLCIPQSGTTAPYLVKLVVLPELELVLGGSPEQLIEPLFNAVIGLDVMQSWLDDDIGFGRDVGKVLVDLSLLLESGEYYVLNPNIKADWASLSLILNNVLKAVFNTINDQLLFEFETDGQVRLVKNNGWYGLQVIHPGISFGDDPEISLVLGKDTKWLDGCGLHNADANYEVNRAGLGFFFVEADAGFNNLDFGCRIVLSDVGIDFHGKGDSHLFDVAGCTAKGIKFHGYLDVTLSDSDEPSKWAVLAEGVDFGFPLGKAAGGDNPVANSIMASDDGKPVNPSFDLTLSYGQKLYATVGDDSDPDGVAWVQINKQFGPMYIKSLGVKLEGVELSILVDGNVELLGLMVEVDDLSLTLDISDPFAFSKWEVDCKGLGIRYISDDLIISGALRKVQDGNQIRYDGVCVIETGGKGFTALGSYTEIAQTGKPSMFVFMVMNATLGGPPMFVVRGLAGGFGYNRDFNAPAVDKVDSFPLVEVAQDAEDIEPLALIQRMGDGNFFPPTPEAYWFAVGIKFTTYEIFKSFGMLYVLLNRGVEVGLLGCTTLEMPENDPIVHVSMNFKALFSSREGIMSAQAQLTSDSWLFDKDCKLQGGFAVASWFAGKHKGDFVITLGGYHSEYNKPAHYPDVPRIGFNWQVSKSTLIKGESYFALTSNAVMAGGQIDATYEKGRLNAWFKIWAHFLIQWKPFFYDINVGVSIGASYTIRIKIPFCDPWYKKLSVELGGRLHIWGPEFAGTATLDWFIISFTVEFGAKGSKPEQLPLDWTDFQREFLPADGSEKKYWNIHAAKGLIEEFEETSGDQDKIWLMKSECTFRTDTVFPTTTTYIGRKDEFPALTIDHTRTNIDIRPMALTGARSAHIFDIRDSSKHSIFSEDTWTRELGAKHIYKRGDDLTRMEIRFDNQEVAKALWQYDLEVDVKDSAPIKGDMGMSVRFYIDNNAALAEVTAISLEQNNYDKSCVLPLPFGFKLYEMLPGQIQGDWSLILNLTTADSQNLVAALYSPSWQNLRIQAVESMVNAGASLISSSELMQSRVHHLLTRKASPKVATLYNGVGEPESSRPAPISSDEDQPWLALGWSLSLLTLPVREVVHQGVVHTSVDRVRRASKMYRVHLDEVIDPKSVKGRVVSLGETLGKTRKLNIRKPQILLAKGRGGGVAQRSLQKQFYRGLDDSKKGAVLNTGMVHLWKSVEEVGKDTKLKIVGSQGTRLCCFDGGGTLLMEREAVGNVRYTLPSRTKLAVLVGLGDSGGIRVKPRAGAVSLASSAKGQPLCGWSSGDLLPQVNLNTLLARGAVLQSSEVSSQSVEPSFITAAEFLNKRSSCVTHFSGTVACVGVLLAKGKGSLKSMARDVEVKFSDGFRVKAGRVVEYGNRVLCLYDVKPEDVKKRVERLSVIVRAKNGWMLGGVCAGRHDLNYWEEHMNLATPPKPDQDLVSSGDFSEVFLSQDNLVQRVKNHKQMVQKETAMKTEYAKKWKVKV